MNITTKEITENIIQGLKNAAVELEEFQLQFALGKADATDKYEELKKKFNHTIHEFNLKVAKGTEKAEELKAKFEELQLQLALGKADTKDMFVEQKEKITKAIQNLEYLLKHNKINEEFIPALKVELEKFKLKLDILYTRYDLESKKKAFIHSIDEIKNKYFKKEQTGWEHFSDEIEESFKHFKNAFKF